MASLLIAALALLVSLVTGALLPPGSPPDPSARPGPGTGVPGGGGARPTESSRSFVRK